MPASRRAYPTSGKIEEEAMVSWSTATSDSAKSPTRRLRILSDWLISDEMPLW
jgi:hypothetical protein